MTMLGKGALPEPMGTLVQSCCKAGKRRMQMNFAEILGDAADLRSTCSFRSAMICSSLCRFRFIVWSLP
jgi:hypothetical protein